jgi:hypothetical protein
MRAITHDRAPGAALSSLHDAEAKAPDAATLSGAWSISDGQQLSLDG